MQLTASHVGYNDTTFTVDNAANFLNIKLSSNTNSRTLSDVQVTALGLTKNGRSVGYSVTDIKGSSIQTAKETNFVNALQGKVAGLQINTNDGSMGGSTKVTIRGNKSYKVCRFQPKRWRPKRAYLPEDTFCHQKERMARQACR